MAIKHTSLTTKPTKDFTNRLKNMARVWKTAKYRAQHEATGGMDDLSDGSYICVVTKGRLAESGKSGRLQIAWEYTILEGEHRGRVIYEYAGLETEDNLMWTARRFAQLGYDISQMEIGELESVLADIVDDKLKVRVSLKTNGEFRNVRIQKNLGQLGRKEAIPTSKPVKEQRVAADEDDEEDEDDVETQGREETDENGEDEEDEDAAEKVSAKTQGNGKVRSKTKLTKKQEADDDDDDEAEDEEDDDEAPKTRKTRTVARADDDEEAEAEDAEEGETGEADDDEDAGDIAYAKGMNVMVFINGKSRSGKILSVNEKSERAKVKLIKLNKTVDVGYTELTPVEA